MVFSSLLFLFAFLPLTVVGYYLLPRRWHNAVLLAASCLFYAWGAPRFFFVLLVSCLLDYALSRWMDRRTGRLRAQGLALAVALNLGLLLYFKYANFFVEELNLLLGVLGLSGVIWTRIALPIGISFFTFQKISYLVDVYRRTTPPATSPAGYGLYVVLFPQLIAGPIVRYHDVADQLHARVHSPEKFIAGIWRFSMGMAKKVLLANTLGQAADAAFGRDLQALTPSGAWAGLLCYSMQIYFDFSGYSDMAIGLGRMFGIEFLENFNWPYIARNFTEFWRRWHISLSNFMREYLYIPLGGSRVAAWRKYLNLWIVFLLCGFWHGASWSFVLWGAYHGFFLSLDKFLAQSRRIRIPTPIAIAGTFLLVILGWVFFRADDLPAALQYFERLFAVTGAGTVGWAVLVKPQAMTALAIGALIIFAPAIPGLSRPLENLRGETAAACGGAVRVLLAVNLLFLAACSLATGNFNPFIYFRF